ncbi:MAG: serine hydrolase domain-containing protein [Saprospiraceae bacterium]
MTDNDNQNQLYQDSLTQVLEEWYQQGHFKGFSVAIADEQGTLYTKGFGFANVADQMAYNQETVQNIASISKTFIGISLLKAQEMGLLNLDDPINQYLPFKVVNPNFPEGTITIRHLTNHTSGIVDSDFYDKSYVLEEVDPDTSIYEVDEAFNQLSDKTSIGAFLEKYLTEGGEFYGQENFLEKQPGAQFDYSNVAATLAAYVLEVAAKEPFDAFTRKHILGPLKMNDSGWSFEQIDLAKHTRNYTPEGKPFPRYGLITYPDGGMRASAQDMAKYLTELIKAKNGAGTLLSKASYETYFKASLADTVFEEGRSEAAAFNDEYDMGIFMGINGLGSYGHSGGDPGTASLLFFNPQTARGSYMILNTDINSQEGVDAFFGIMATLKDYEDKFKR